MVETQTDGRKPASAVGLWQRAGAGETDGWFRLNGDGTTDFVARDTLAAWEKTQRADGKDLLRGMKLPARLDRLVQQRKSGELAAALADLDRIRATSPEAPQVMITGIGEPAAEPEQKDDAGQVV